MVTEMHRVVWSYPNQSVNGAGFAPNGLEIIDNNASFSAISSSLWIWVGFPSTTQTTVATNASFGNIRSCLRMAVVPPSPTVGDRTYSQCFNCWQHPEQFVDGVLQYAMHVLDGLLPAPLDTGYEHTFFANI